MAASSHLLIHHLGPGNRHIILDKRGRQSLTSLVIPLSSSAATDESFHVGLISWTAVKHWYGHWFFPSLAWPININKGI